MEEGKIKVREKIRAMNNRNFKPIVTPEPSRNHLWDELNGQFRDRRLFSLLPLSLGDRAHEPGSR